MTNIFTTHTLAQRNHTMVLPIFLKQRTALVSLVAGCLKIRCCVWQFSQIATFAFNDSKVHSHSLPFLSKKSRNVVRNSLGTKLKREASNPGYDIYRAWICLKLLFSPQFSQLCHKRCSHHFFMAFFKGLRIKNHIPRKKVHVPMALAMITPTTISFFFSRIIDRTSLYADSRISSIVHLLLSVDNSPIGDVGRGSHAASPQPFTFSRNQKSIFATHPLAKQKPLHSSLDFNALRRMVLARAQNSYQTVSTHPIVRFFMPAFMAGVNGYTIPARENSVRSFGTVLSSRHQHTLLVNPQKEPKR